MAVRTYRYRLQVPCAPLDQIESETGVSLSVSDHAGGVYIDIDCEEANAGALQDAMNGRGFEFIEGDPPDSAEAAFKSYNDLTGLGAIGLGRAIFKVDGGLVYDSNGHPCIKVSL